MAVKPQRISVPITVSLRQDSVQRLVPNENGAPVADVLAAYGSEFLQTAADGGLMLKPEQLAEIEKNYGKQIRLGQDVVKATMSRAGRSEGGDLAVQVNLDPTWKAGLEELAAQSGRTLQDLLIGVYEMALENNWLYGLKVDGPRFTLSKDAQEFFAKRIEGQFTFQKLTAYVKSLEKAPKETHELAAV